jgi:glycosyltransferase involved in cell wall biosynthesis
MRHRLNIAWLGPVPNERGGVPYMALQLLEALPAAGASVDAFWSSPGADVPERLRDVPGLEVVQKDPGWRYDRWYSRTDATKMLTGLPARALGQTLLTREIVRRHAARPYDVLYQFSQTELLALRAVRRGLPPIVLHPETHAAGELRWVLRERHMDAAQRHPARRGAFEALLRARSAQQRRDITSVARVIAPSAVFRDELIADYGLDVARTGVVPNPVDLERFRPPPDAVRWTGEGPVVLLFVARISTRKGVELLVDLSHRVRDLAGRLRLVVVGGPSQWSDLRPVLDGLAPEVAEYRGGVPFAELREVYDRAHGSVQPSHYEPFALTVAEALASGLPVVLSDAVGAAEWTSAPAARRFGAGDAAGFEAAVRALVDDIEQGRGPELGRAARATAEAAFAPDRVAAQLVDELASAARPA